MNLQIPLHMQQAKETTNTTVIEAASTAFPIPFQN